MSNKEAREKAVARDQEFVLEYLATHPCVVCGETDISVLTFHHIDPDTKQYNVSDMIAHGYAIETLQRELDRCEVLCWNDHMRLEQETTKKGKKFWLF